MHHHHKNAPIHTPPAVIEGITKALNVMAASVENLRNKAAGLPINTTPSTDTSALNRAFEYSRIAQEGKAFIAEKEKSKEIKKLNETERTYLIHQYVGSRTTDPVLEQAANANQQIIKSKAEHDYEAAQKYIKEHKHDNDLNHKIFKVVKVIVIGCAAVFVPPLAGFAAGTLGAALVTGATCAATDALCQGAAIELGLQNDFSLNEVLEAGVGSAAGAGSVTLNFVTRAAASSAAAAETQILELVLETREDLDLTRRSKTR